MYIPHHLPHYSLLPIAYVILLLGVTEAIAETTNKEKTTPKVTKVLQGKASFYYGKWIGRKTANGEIYKRDDITAAHKTLPFNTRAKVTNLRNGKSVVVRINNRGPYIKGRIIDLSLAAAQKIQMTKAGVVPVKVEVLSN